MFTENPNALTFPRSLFRTSVSLAAGVILIFTLYASFSEPDVDVPAMFDVDVVVTWVDPTDTAWREQFEFYAKKEGIRINLERLPTSSNGTAKDELYYCLQGVIRNIPWARQLYIITQRPQRPAYLKELQERAPFPIRVVHHDEYIPTDTLPTFNSAYIELFFDRIPGLAERFVYVNDDMYVLKPRRRKDFFTHDGKAIAPILFPGFAFNEYKCRQGSDFQCRNAYMQKLFGIHVWYSRYHIAYAQTRRAFADFRERAGKVEVAKMGAHAHRSKVGLNFNFGIVNLNHRDYDLPIFHVPYKFCFLKRKGDVKKLSKALQDCDLLCLNVIDPSTPQEQADHVFSLLDQKLALPH